MHSFSALSAAFEEKFKERIFDTQPVKLYDAAQYILSIGGKRVRPVALLMANELFTDINNDAWNIAMAIELFHNFSLIHDDIMDKAPLRRNHETVHIRFGESTAILAGDVMLVKAYDYINKINPKYLSAVLHLFNKTAAEVCEGQQLDMDFESETTVGFEAYSKMIELKTSVLLGCSLQMGAILGGAGLGNQQHLFAFGKKLGMAFQVQDDYLDAFGNPEKFGKQIGGDILANKKTFLLIHALSVATPAQHKRLQQLMLEDGSGKIDAVLQLFKDCGVDAWANALKEKYYEESLQHLEAVAVISSRKKDLADLAAMLLQRES